jgi:response regulator RpfG family c-di-GMP phosphodiesterase
VTDRILFVDDDLKIQRAYRRRLGDYFQLETASSGTEGLQFLQTRGPFAVVVSDMRMPGMDGVQFLSQVKVQAPRTVRMMLTGFADTETAIEAVNEGHIFRFLTKPCPAETLAKALSAGIEQYRLIMAERELLGKTLKGSIEVLTEILSLVNPNAFSQATRIKHIVRDIAVQLQLPNPWQYELAAMLSQIGCVMVSPEILEKINARVPLSTAEEKLFASHPAIGRELLERIPRLDLIGRIIEGQQKPVGAPVSPAELNSDEDVIALGTQLLNLVLAFDKMSARGSPHNIIMSVLRRQVNVYNPYLLDALETIEVAAVEQGLIEELPVSELRVGMIVMQDVWSMNELLLVHQGQEITPSILVRLRNFDRRVGVVEPVRVRAMPD